MKKIRFLLILTALISGSIAQASVFAWYQSPQALYSFCKSVSFENPLCPKLTGLYEVYASPTGPLSDQSLMLAATALRLDRPSIDWLEGLNLTGQKPEGNTEELWQNAKWIYGQALYLQKKFPESLKIYDGLNDTFKRRAIFHQQRAWIQYFSGKYELALGSIISAESPLVDKVPFIRKHLLRALIERDTCQYAKALQTIADGRKALETLKPNREDSALVRACRADKESNICDRVGQWYEAQFQEEVHRGLKDLDYLEAELTDRVGKTPEIRAAIGKPIVWPFVGEAWLDELGNYSVDVLTSCSEGESQK